VHEYNEMQQLMENGKMLKGAWDAQPQKGQISDTREG
jgi:hypothetical protein